MAAEQWCPVVGFEELYEVSDHGRVRSLGRTTLVKPSNRRAYALCHKGRVLKPAIDGGYSVVTLTAPGRRANRAVHRLVLEAFVGPCPLGMECLHDDGDGQHNALGNLRWGTSAENNHDRQRHGRVPQGESVYSAKLTEGDVRLIRMVRPLFSGRQLADVFGVSQSLISSVANHRSWAHVQ